jgi:hypothetical protein
MPIGSPGKGGAAAWIMAHVSHQSNECLWWPMGRDTRGYGQAAYMGKLYRAHRLMCEFVHGPAPTPEHHAAHNCGNGHQGCVNPRHLSWKTASENQMDRKAHGTAKTSRGSASRRTAEETEAIRRAIGTDTVTALAARFKVSRRTIERIRGGANPRPLSQDPYNIRRRLTPDPRPR